MANSHLRTSRAPHPGVHSQPTLMAFSAGHHLLEYLPFRNRDVQWRLVIPNLLTHTFTSNGSCDETLVWQNQSNRDRAGMPCALSTWEILPPPVSALSSCSLAPQAILPGLWASPAALPHLVSHQSKLRTRVTLMPPGRKWHSGINSPLSLSTSLYNFVFLQRPQLPGCLEYISQ